VLYSALHDSMIVAFYFFIRISITHKRNLNQPSRHGGHWWAQPF